MILDDPDVLAVLRNLYRVRSATVQEFSALVEKSECGEKGIQFPINLVLHGPREARDEVGEILSKARLRLQHPSNRRPDVLGYSNPHVFGFGEPSETPTSHARVIGESIDARREVEGILDGSLDHRQKLKLEAKISKLVNTPLRR